MTTTCDAMTVVAARAPRPAGRQPARAPVETATEAEIRAPMPGDGLVPGCQYVMTRAVSINAPPDAVWPWLVAAGAGRAGFYANDLLGNVGRADADGTEHLVWATPDSTWAWTLARCGAGTRLVTRLRMLYRCNRSSEAVFSRMLDDCEDVPVMVKTLLAVKQRAEAAHSPNG
jgi:hypothetical protein